MSIHYKNTPLPIYLISAIFFFIPVISFFMTANYLNIPLAQPGIIFRQFSLFSYFLMIISLFIGYGLLKAKKWAYYLFLFFAFIIIFYNFAMMGIILFRSGKLSEPHSTTLSGIVLNTLITVIFSGVLLYFLQKEISAPYLSILPRGWRNKLRDTIPVFVTWENQLGKREQCRTKNISRNGLFIPLKDYNELKPDDKVNLIIDLEEPGTPAILMDGIVIRTMDPEEALPGAGIKFIRDEKYRSGSVQLDSFIEEKYAPRFEIANPVTFTLEMSRESFNGNLYNLSSGGLYIESSHIPKTGEIISVMIEKLPLKLELVGKVVWPNHEARHEKQKGFGVTIEYVKNPFRFALLLWKLNWRANKRR